jgi:hypothetical protein
VARAVSARDAARAGLHAADADNPRAVRAISDEVRARIQAALDDMLAKRRSIFFGSIFDRRTNGAV